VVQAGIKPGIELEVPMRRRHPGQGQIGGEEGDGEQGSSEAAQGVMAVRIEAGL
jgi:hypothetical protein